MKPLGRDQRGALNALLIPFIMVAVFFLAAAGFGAWAYMSRQDYKNNVDGKISQAVDIAKQQEATAKDNEFIQREKEPLKDYNGPAAYGSVNVKFPKTWSAYIVEGKSSSVLDAYFNPNYVPGVDSDTIYALRVQVLATSYDTVVQRLNNQVKSGKVTVTPYTAPKVAGVVGVRVDGEIVSKKQGSMVIFPLRDKTLQVSTEANQFKGDFDNIILPNLVFTP